MKKLAPFLVVLTMLMGLLAGCGGTKTADPAKDPAPATGTPATDAKKPLKIALLINGTLGDKSFFDSANEGMKRIQKDFGADPKVIEMGADPSKWEPSLQDVSEQKYDLIILGTWQMTELLEKTAPKYPKNKYVIFDTTVDYKKPGLDNVYSILYNQNEGSFLAGVLAASVANSKLPLANDKHMIGFLGGDDSPVINDFLVGYIQGAKSVDPKIKVAVSYVGDFSNPAKGKEQALSQYQSGVSIAFNVAGQSGLGQLDAAKELKKYAIGVDSDQAALFQTSDKAKSDLILSSMMKRVDNSLYRAVGLFKDGKLKFGSAEALGLKDDAVGLADNEVYQKNVPAEVKAKITELKDKLLKGEIKVDTAFGMDNKKLDEIRNAVKP